MSYEEYFDVVDENNNLMGEVKLKSEIHARGLWHRAVHVWIVNSKKEILVQKRAKTKKSWPGCWDVSVGGHIGTGEDITFSAARELEEEIGIKTAPDNLQFLFITKEGNPPDKNGYIENVFQHVYILREDIKLEDCILLEYEVEAIKYIAPDELLTEVKEHPNEWMPHWEEYDKIVAHIKTLPK